MAPAADGEELGDDLVGSVVRLHGLATELLNGRLGAIVSSDRVKGRCGVAMLMGGSTKSIKTANVGLAKQYHSSVDDGLGGNKIVRMRSKTAKERMRGLERGSQQQFDYSRMAEA